MTSLIEAAQAAELLEARRAADPLAAYRPTSKQTPFLESEKSEAFAFGANRTGKSLTLAAIVASMLRFGRLNPLPVYAGKVQPLDEPSRVWIIGLSHGLMAQTLQPFIFDNGLGAGAKPFIPDEEIEDFDKKRQILRLKNGSVGAFHSADAGRDKAQGGAVHLAAFDEAPPVGMYREVAARLAAGRKLYIRMAATLLPPPGIQASLGWIFSDIVKPWQKGEKPNIDIVTSSMTDNPHLAPEAVETLKSIYAPTSVDYQVRIEGKLVPRAFTATPLYHTFNRAIHVDRRISRVADPNRPLLFAYDVNVRPMTAVVAQEAPDGTIVVRDELFLNPESGATLPMLMTAFKQKYPTHSAPLRIYGDATSKARNAQTTQTDYDTVLNELQGYPAPVEVYVPTSNPYVHDRVAAVNVALLGPGGLVSLRVAPWCRELIADLEEVQSDGKGGVAKTKNMDDPAYYRSHVSDALGYLVFQIRPVRVDDRRSKRGRMATIMPTPSYNFGRHEPARRSVRVGNGRVAFGGEAWR